MKMMFNFKLSPETKDILLIALRSYIYDLELTLRSVSDPEHSAVYLWCNYRLKDAKVALKELLNG